MRKEKRLQTVQATEKTLELLEILATGSEDLHIGELAAKLRMGRNEVLLLLVTLESRGMARWDERVKIYRAGWKSTELARHLLRWGKTPETPQGGKAVAQQKAKGAVRHLASAR